MNKELNIIQSIEKDLLRGVELSFYREDFKNIDWSNNALGVFGERGVGKTTMLLQKRKETEGGLYFSADNSIIRSKGLFLFVHYCYDNFDIRHFFIDEIFRYNHWQQELKNCIDSLPGAKIVFSGSSSMALYDGVVDLGRRVYDYHMNGLSFREYLFFKYRISLPRLTLEELLKNHQKYSVAYSLEFKERYFEEYCKQGVYPFGLTLSFDSFINRLIKTLDRVIIEDLPYIQDFRVQSLDKLSKLFYFIANTTPSELSILSLSQKIGIDKNVVDNAIFLLSKIGVIHTVQKGEKLSEKVRKEFKIFLGNTNQYFVYNNNPPTDTLREAFFVNEMKKLKNSTLTVPGGKDFGLQYQGAMYFFEIGGTRKNISHYPLGTWIIKDDIRVSENSQIIPLWLFGFLS